MHPDAAVLAGEGHAGRPFLVDAGAGGMTGGRVGV